MDELVKQLAGQAPAVIALIWAISYMGGKVDRLEKALQALGTKIDEALRGKEWDR